MSQANIRIRFRRPKWARLTHPVYWLEAQRNAANRGLSALQLIFLPALFGIAGLALLSPMPILLTNPTADSLMSIGLILILVVVATIEIGAGALGTVLVIAQTSPTISGEIELQSWHLLRTTTLPLHEIIMAKYSAALIHLRLTLGGLMTLRLITTITSILLFAYIVLRGFNTTYSYATDYFSQLKWLPLMFPLAIVTVAYLGQPVVQFLLNGALGMLASVYTRTRAQAIAAAFMVRLGLWAAVALINIAAYSGLSAALSMWSQPQYASIQSYRSLPIPSSDAITWVTCILISGYAVSILANQIGVTLLCLGLVMRRARKLGV